MANINYGKGYYYKKTDYKRPSKAKSDAENTIWLPIALAFSDPVQTKYGSAIRVNLRPLVDQETKEEVKEFTDSAGNKYTWEEVLHRLTHYLYNSKKTPCIYLYPSEVKPKSSHGRFLIPIEPEIEQQLAEQKINKPKTIYAEGEIPF